MKQIARRALHGIITQKTELFNVKVDLKTGWESLVWIQLAKGRTQ